MSIFPKSFNTISSVTVTNSKTLINKYKDLLFDTTTKKVIVKDGKTEFTDKKSKYNNGYFFYFIQKWRNIKYIKILSLE